MRLLDSQLAPPPAFLLRVFNFQASMPDVQPKPPEQAHIDVGDPRPPQPRKEISAPSRQKQLEACQRKKKAAM